MTHSFKPAEFNGKINNLISNGYQEYLTTMEDGITHVILTNTNPKSPYNGSVVDIWDSGKLEYSGQFNGPLPKPLI